MLDPVQPLEYETGLLTDGIAHSTENSEPQVGFEPTTHISPLLTLVLSVFVQLSASCNIKRSINQGKQSFVSNENTSADAASIRAYSFRFQTSAFTFPQNKQLTRRVIVSKKTVPVGLNW